MDSNIKVTVVKSCRFHTLSNMLIFCLLLNDNGKKMNLYEGSWGWYGIMDDCAILMKNKLSSLVLSIYRFFKL